MSYTVLTRETPDEFAERMITSYAKEAFKRSRETTANAPFLAGWYARECVRLDRWRFHRKCDAIIDNALLEAGCVRVV